MSDIPEGFTSWTTLPSLMNGEPVLNVHYEYGGCWYKLKHPLPTRGEQPQKDIFLHSLVTLERAARDLSEITAYTNQEVEFDALADSLNEEAHSRLPMYTPGVVRDQSTMQLPGLASTIFGKVT